MGGCGGDGYRYICIQNRIRWIALDVEGGTVGLV